MWPLFRSAPQPAFDEWGTQQPTTRSNSDFSSVTPRSLFGEAPQETDQEGVVLPLPTATSARRAPLPDTGSASADAIVDAKIVQAIGLQRQHQFAAARRIYHEIFSADCPRLGVPAQRYLNRDFDGISPVLACIFAHDVDSLALLLRQGALVVRRVGVGQTFMDHLMDAVKLQFSAGIASLYVAAQRDKAKAEYFLSDKHRMGLAAAAAAGNDRATIEALVQSGVCSVNELLQAARVAGNSSLAERLFFDAPLMLEHRVAGLR